MSGTCNEGFIHPAIIVATGVDVKISISAYSLHRNIGEGNVSMLDFIGIASERYGVHAVELNSPFFENSPGYLKRLKDALEEHGVAVQNIAVDLGNIADPDESKRVEWVNKNADWLDVARRIGCRSIRVNAGHAEDGEAGLRRSIESYRRIVRRAKRLGMMVLLENHGGYSSDPASILKYVSLLGTANFGTCPDFGNFDPAIRYMALEKVAPYAKFVHGKTYEFDAEGNETTLDIPRIIKILQQAHYNGFVSVEYEGRGDEYEGIASTIALFQRCGLEL